MDQSRCKGDLLHGVLRVISGSTEAIAIELFSLLQSLLPHSALVMLSADATGGSMQWAGDAAFAHGVQRTDLDLIRKQTESIESIHIGEMQVNDAPRTILQAVARNGAVLVLADVESRRPDHLVLDIWNLVSPYVQGSADEAAPSYLHRARSTTGARLVALGELTEEVNATFATILLLLRSHRLSDAEARGAAIDRTTEGMLKLRTSIDRVQTLTEEPVGLAFERLRDELEAVTRHTDIDLSVVSPPDCMRSLPDEIARGTRALAKGAVLSRTAVPGIRRVRVEVACDDTNLTLSVRDDGPGTGEEEVAVRRAVKSRADALRGRVEIRATPDWGTELSISIPLDPPNAKVSMAASGLRPREIEVAELLIAGHSNRAIAKRLAISESTVKFHVSRILQNLDVSSRSEAVALLMAERIA